LYQPDFATPQQGALLWVYEGLTQYLGYVLAARTGFETQAQYRETLALTAARLDYRPGRDWRSTEDTAIAASIMRGNVVAWDNWRRGQDYYQEGELLWLDADTLIRKMTNEKKSLNDFERIFLAKGGNTGPEIVPYRFDELVEDLNAVVPYDWAKFLHDRTDNINLHADLAGIEQGGYKLVYQDKPSASELALARAREPRFAGFDNWYSIGLRLATDGSIADVRWGGPGDKAQLAPGEKIIAVDGRIYSADALHEALREAKGASEPIHLIVQADSFVRMVDIDYHDGERHPVLQRIDGAPDYLDEITKPLTAPEAAAAEKKQTE
jgi:predicted metalloprotease with PDZ domain